MPHIIVEYPKQLANDTQVEAMLQAIHRAVAQGGLFQADHIRTRAYAFTKFTNAGGSEPYIHIQARIKSGRDTENKKQLGDAILNSLRPLGIPAAVITVEIIDMERESYGKYAPG